MKALAILGLSFGAAATVMAFAAPAHADTVIKNPSDHPSYKAELDPHADMVLFHPGYGVGGYRGRGRYDTFGSPEFGAGFRATIKIVDPGFIPKLNNTVGITFGIDATNCQGCRAGYGWSLWTPVGINWSFFITDKFSAFADLGFNLRTEGFYHHVWPDFMFELGGRYHFNDHVALMFRVGYPFVTFGPTFFI
jgi:hypothetical protein